MVIAEDEYNNFGACILGTVTIEYKRILWISPAIFSHPHKLG
jgi:hypothetical protein